MRDVQRTVAVLDCFSAHGLRLTLRETDVDAASRSATAARRANRAPTRCPAAGPRPPRIRRKALGCNAVSAHAARLSEFGFCDDVGSIVAAFGFCARHRVRPILLVQTGMDLRRVAACGSTDLLLHLAAPKLAAVLGRSVVDGLGITGAKCPPGVSDAPTSAETIPGYEVQSWNALFAPAGTPLSVVEPIADHISQGLKRTDALDALLAIRLCSPEDRNSLTPEPRGRLGEAVESAQTDRPIRSVFLTAEGPRFCSGGELKMLEAASDPWPVHRRFRGLTRWLIRPITLDKPVVVGVEGAAAPDDGAVPDADPAQN